MPIQFSISNILTPDHTRFDRTVAPVRANRWLGIGAPTIGWGRAALRSIYEIRDRIRRACDEFIEGTGGSDGGQAQG